jgi:hypothetical protein
VTTLGKVKDALNQAIVRRIAQAALLQTLPGGEYSAAGPPVEHTFSSIEEAAAPLPESLTSLVGPVPYAQSEPNWTSLDPGGVVDWESRLRGF